MEHGIVKLFFYSLMLLCTHVFDRGIFDAVRNWFIEREGGVRFRIRTLVYTKTQILL